MFGQLDQRTDRDRAIERNDLVVERNPILQGFREAPTSAANPATARV
jgi:hypothetical protein